MSDVNDSQLSPTPFIFYLCYAGMEEVAITFINRHEHVDVRSIWQALKYYKKNK